MQPEIAAGVKHSSGNSARWLWRGEGFRFAHGLKNLNVVLDLAVVFVVIVAAGDDR